MYVGKYMSDTPDALTKLNKLEEQRKKILRDHLKQELGNHPRFVAMADAYRKTKKHLTKVTRLTEDEKYKSKRQALQDKLDALEQERAKAMEAQPNLESLISDHEAAQNKLIAALLTSMEDGSLPGDIHEQVDNILDEIGTETLEQEPSDPLAKPEE
jgi:uncharacterized protein involved in exopolysaccharide biosynthesis